MNVAAYPPYYPSYFSHHHPQQQQQQQQAPLAPHHHHHPPIEYIYNIHPTDVLCGRGGATNSHIGNRSFRELVDKHRNEYLKAKKRDKPSVASYVVDLVRERGGRFLRKANVLLEGRTAWFDIGDVKAVEKTCQALRENAPERRRQLQQTSCSSSGSVCIDLKRSSSSILSNSPPQESQEATIAQGSPVNDDDAKKQGTPKTLSTITTTTTPSPATPAAQESSDEDRDDDEDYEDLVVIRPALPFVRRRLHSVRVQDLSAHERDLYRTDFDPPKSDLKRRKTHGRASC